MDLKGTLTKAILIATTAVAVNAPASHVESENDHAPKIVQKADTQKEVPNFIAMLGRGEKITHNGLTFDTPKFNQVKDKNKVLSRFNIKIGDDVGFEIKDPNNANKIYALSMPRDDAEVLIGATLAYERDRENGTNEIKDKIGRFTTMENGTVRNMTKEELQIYFDGFKDTLLELHSNKIINIGAIKDTYFKKMDKVMALAANAYIGVKTIFSYGPLIELGRKPMENLYKHLAYANSPKGIADRKAETAREEKLKQMAAQRIADQKALEEAEKILAAQTAQERETNRLASLVNIKGENFAPKLESEDDTLMKVKRATLFFEEPKHYVEVSSFKTKYMHNIQATISEKLKDGEQFVSRRDMQPEELNAVVNILNEKLTPEQKTEMADLLKGLEKKAGEGEKIYLVAPIKRIAQR